MEQIDVVCPDPEFKKFVRSRLDDLRGCLAKKISWTMAGVVVAALSVICFLVYEAYSGEQERQCKVVENNTLQVQELKTNAKVIEVKFGYISQSLYDLKVLQEKQLDVIMKKLNKIDKKGGEIE